MWHPAATARGSSETCAACLASSEQARPFFHLRYVHLRRAAARELRKIGSVLQEGLFSRRETRMGQGGGRLRSFDILVDCEKVVTQTLEIHPGELFDFEYPLPEQLTRGKQRITVKFQAQPNSIAGSVFDVRVAQLDK